MRVPLLLVAIALLPAASWAQTAIPTWSLEPQMRIGSADGGDYALNSVDAITVSPATGAIFIAQYGEIQAFSAEGRHLQTFGRRGEGPGEFRRVAALGWSGDLLVALKDWPGQGHAMRFTEEGALVEDRRIDIENLPDGVTRGRGHPVASLDGGYYLWRVSAPQAPGERPYDPLLRTNGEGDDTLLDRLAGEPVWREAPLTGVQRLTGPSLVSADAAGSAFVIVHQHAPESPADARFRVRKVDASGRLLFARSYDFRPRPVPPNYADSLIQAGVEVISAYRAYPNLEEMLRRNTRIPRYQPPVTKVLLALDGSVWLRREDVHVGSVLWTILDARGNIAGQLSVAADQRLLYVAGDTVWGVERDSLDVQYAVRYRIRR